MNSPKWRVLVIEDDLEMRSLLEDFIKQEGYEVKSVDNGSQAFILLAREDFDLIITDIMMPGLSGLDILPGLKKLQPQSSVIVITAFGTEEVQRRALEKGACGYLEKPLHLEDLKIMIREMIPPKPE